jgi:hypothetical protein
MNLEEGEIDLFDSQQSMTFNPINEGSNPMFSYYNHAESVDSSQDSHFKLNLTPNG